MRDQYKRFKIVPTELPGQAGTCMFIRRVEIYILPPHPAGVIDVYLLKKVKE